MCGIVGYLGPREASEVVLQGLQRLEYRGYDSAGLAVVNGQLSVAKKKGKVADLKHHIQDMNLSAHLGIGHTRWATHGEPNDVNAHPHRSGKGRLALVHNGIIENYEVLREELLQKGHTFEGQTDTEVLAHFIEDIWDHAGGTLEQALQIALSRVVGAYAIVVISEEEPDTLFAARKSSPLVIGVGQGEYFLASDATPLVAYTQEVVYLEDDQLAVINRQGMTLHSELTIPTTPYIQTLDMELETIEKGGYEHFMLKEIHEQPKSLSNCMRGRLSESLDITLGGLHDFHEAIAHAERIIIVACGTSWHSGLVAEYFFEETLRVPVEVEYASEFRYRNPIIREGDIIIAISQSGETADTLAAMKLAKERGATVLGICNVVGSSIARLSDAGLYTHAGPEIGVASTKAFTAQLVALYMMGLQLARSKGSISEARYRRLALGLSMVPSKIEQCLATEEAIRQLSSNYKDATNFIYLGRGYNFPVALEGALKLKEISYIHAEGYPAAEMKHGPIALIDKDMPVVFIATRDSSYDKVVSNIQEVKARQGKVIAVVSEGDSLIPALADHIIEVPATDEELMPLVAVVPLQLLSYHIAILRGCDVDQPRNLAKSVTVE